MAVQLAVGRSTRTNGSETEARVDDASADPASPEQTGAGNATPIVYDGVTYVQDGWTRITALDGATGKILWQFDPKVGLNTPGNGTHMRSVGMGDGMIFAGAYGTVYGINAETGAQVWATQVVNPVGGGGIDVSPVYYKGLVIIGTTGGDWGGSCIAVALDAKTGKVKWHYSLVPSNPKAFGWNSWPVNRYYYGGAAVWDEPAIDPTTGFALYGTGQPLPFNGLINGPGAELGTDGVYALDAMTGKFKWFYQEVHHDIWDYDGMQTPKVISVDDQRQEAEPRRPHQQERLLLRPRPGDGEAGYSGAGGAGSAGCRGRTPTRRSRSRSRRRARPARPA